MRLDSLLLQRELMAGCLLLLWVPVLARRLRGLPGLGSGHPADVAFYVAAILVTWLVPRGPGLASAPAVGGAWLPIVLAIASSALALLYVAVVREARHIATRLVAVLLVVDLAAVVVIRGSVAAGLGMQVYVGLLLLVTGSAGFGSTWVAARLRGPRADGS